MVKFFDIILYVFLIILIAICLYPFLYIINISISGSHEITNGSVYLIPKGINFTAFSIVLQSKMIISGYLNSILYAVCGTFLTLVLSTTAGYVLTVKEFKPRKYVTTFFVATMFFGGGIIPTFLVINKLGMIDTIWAMIVPVSLSAWSIILFRTNFKYIPQDIIDSAKIDGAGHFWIYARIVIPLSKAIIATLGLFAIVGQWNSFFPALMYLTSQEKMPLMIVLRKIIVVGNVRGELENLIGKYSTVTTDGIGLGRGIKMASVLVSIGPIIFIFPFLQKYFVKGALIGSIKE